MEPERPARLLLFLAVGALPGTAALFPTPADGEIQEPASLAELARDADVIVIGRVSAVIPSLFSLPGMAVMVAFAVGAHGVLRWRRIRFPAVVRDGLLLALVLLFGGLAIATTSRGCHRRIAIVHVDRPISGSSASWIPVWFANNFACDATKLEPGSRYLLFLEGRGVGYRMSWYDLSAWKEGADGFHCWRGPGSGGPHVEEDIIRELQRLSR